MQTIYGTKAAAAWREQLTATTHNRIALTDSHMARVWDALERQVRQRDANAAATDPAPPTLARLYWTALGNLLAFFGALLGNLDGLTATHSWPTWTTVTLAQTAVGLLALRFARTRRLASAWLLAITIAVALAAAGVLIETA